MTAGLHPNSMWPTSCGPRATYDESRRLVVPLAFWPTFNQLLLGIAIIGVVGLTAEWSAVGRGPVFTMLSLLILFSFFCATWIWYHLSAREEPFDRIDTQRSGQLTESRLPNASVIADAVTISRICRRRFSGEPEVFGVAWGLPVMSAVVLALSPSLVTRKGTRELLALFLPNDEWIHAGQSVLLILFGIGFVGILFSWLASEKIYWRLAPGCLDKMLGQPGSVKCILAERFLLEHFRIRCEIPSGSVRLEPLIPQGASVVIKLWRIADPEGFVSCLITYRQADDRFEKLPHDELSG